MRFRAKFRADQSTFADLCPLFNFQNGGRPPYWICFTCIWTTDKEYLLVFVTVKNFVKIGAVVSFQKILLVFKEICSLVANFPSIQPRRQPKIFL